MPRVQQVVWALLGVVSAFTADTWAQPKGPPAAKVRLDDVRTESVERWREVTGELRAVRRATVAAEEAGQVIEFGIEPGDRVDLGEVIARLDSSLAGFEVERAKALVLTREATVAERTSTLEKAQRDLQRIEDSYSRSGASQIEMDEARTNKATAEARLAQAKADVAWAQSDQRTAEKRLGDMTVKAPFAGVVLVKRTEVGQWLNEGDTVIEVVALDALDAWLDVPESFAARLLPRNGESPEVVLRIPALRAVGAEESLRAQVSSVIPSADPLSRLFPVRVRVNNIVSAAGSPGIGSGGEGALRPGMTVVGLIPTGESGPAMTVNKDAVLRNETGAFVYFDGGGVAAIAPVRVEYAVGQRMVIQSPVLKPGMKVVIEGNERMYPGQPLLNMDAPPPPPPPPPSPSAAGAAPAKP